MARNASGEPATLEKFRRYSNQLEDYLRAGGGSNAQDPRQLPIQAVQLLDWAQEQGWLIDADDFDQRLGLLR